MLTSTKLFKLVINNNYDELSVAILNKQVNFKAQNKKKNYILSSAIEYRSVECFELLVNAISDTSDKLNIYESGLYQAIKYYGNAPNTKNKYFIEKLLNKNIKINNNEIHLLTQNLVVFNQFSEYVLNNKPEMHLTEFVLIDSTVYEIIFNYCLENNLLNDEIIKIMIDKSFKLNKEHIIILLKNSKYVNNIWIYCPNIIDKLFNENMSKILLTSFVNLYNIHKPSNITIDTIIDNILLIQSINNYGYYARYNKNFINKIEKLNILLLLFNIKNINCDIINKKICKLITEPFTIKHKNYMSFYITLLVKFIEITTTFELNLSFIDTKYYDFIKTYKSQILFSGLKALINELIKLNKIIPIELNFIKDDNLIIPIELIIIKQNKKK
jgi:hypothetical protein